MNTSIESPRPGLFDQIITAINTEHQLRQTRKILSSFLLLFFSSVLMTPFSVAFFISEWNASGVEYFITTALQNGDVFFSAWQDFIFSIIESLPLVGILCVTLNIIMMLFTVKLFLHRKQLLLRLAFGS